MDMTLSANDIVNRIMEKAIDTASLDNPGNSLPKYHVSQTADQLPDFKVRNAFYRSELERQIQEKRDAERRRKEREVLEEERLLRKIDEDREKLRREYLEEIDKRRIIQEETAKRQLTIAKKLEEIQLEAEERKRDEEENRRRQNLISEQRIVDLKEAIDKRKAEEAHRRRLIIEQVYGDRLPLLTTMEDSSRSLALTRYGGGGDVGNGLNLNVNDYLKRPWNMPGWNSRDYVHSALHPESLILEDVYFEAPLNMLADVYKKLDTEKRRIKEIMRQRIVQGEL